MAQPIRPLRPNMDRWIKAIPKRLSGLVYVFQPLISYESRPGESDKELPEETRDPTDEQLAQCQAIFDDCEARRAHIEQKAQWTFTAIAFLMPTLASILVFLIRDPAFGPVDYPLSFVFLLVSGCFLILSFVSALRAMKIRAREFLHIHSVIDKEDGTFLEYRKDFHAQGLLYCATMNTATNDHIAQFVKGAHILLVIAVICFASGVIITYFNMTAHMSSPIKTKVVETVSFSPDALSKLYSDIRKVAVADRAAIARTENQMKLLSDRVVELEAEVNALQNQVQREGDTSPQP